jgi:hypothetical protein
VNDRRSTAEALEPEDTMDEPSLETLTQRLERLERDNRRLRRMGGGFLIGLIALLLTAQAVPPARIVEAQHFVVKDGAGKKRAELTTSDTGPELVFVDTMGRRKAALGLALGEPHLVMFGYDRYGTAPVQTLRVALTREASSISLNDAKGKQVRISLFDDASGITLTDGRGRNRLALALDDEGLPTLLLRDAHATARLELGLIGDDPFLALRDGDASPRIQLSHTAERSALLFVDKEERGRASLGVAAEGPLLHLAAGQGHVSLGAPPGVLEIRDANGALQSELIVGADGMPRLEFYDSTGAKITIGAGATAR